VGRDASYLARWIRMFQWNPFHQYSDESVYERNRLLLTTECHDNTEYLDFLFVVSNPLRISHLKACIHILDKKSSFTLYIVLSITLQVEGLGTLIPGSVTAASDDFANDESKKGKINFCYQ